MTLEQIDNLSIVKTNLALLKAIRLDELDQSAQFGFDRMIAEAFSIIGDIVDQRQATA
jgi:hypothetical protein